MSEPATGRDAAVAGRLLERLFRSLDVPLVFRLWDGTRAHVGASGDPGFTIVFRSRPAFRRCLRHPTPLGFGEAFIAGDIDVEGDLFAAMRTANALEGLRVPLTTRLRTIADVLRV
jgi:cyclopropane-fatty-acyl-phospholipid synthase